MKTWSGPVGTPPKIEQDLPEQKKEAFQLLVDSVVALVRENKEVLWSSMVKETMKRKKPSFNESYHGYRTFSDLLEDAEEKGIIRLRTDSRSGTYVVIGFGKEKKKGEQEELKELKETKEHKEIKERKPQKPRWRPRTRKPSAKSPVAASGTESPASSGDLFSRTRSSGSPDSVASRDRLLRAGACDVSPSLESLSYPERRSLRRR